MREEQKRGERGDGGGMARGHGGKQKAQRPAGGAKRSAKRDLTESPGAPEVTECRRVEWEQKAFRGCQVLGTGTRREAARTF